MQKASEEGKSQDLHNSEPKQRLGETVQGMGQSVPEYVDGENRNAKSEIRNSDGCEETLQKASEEGKSQDLHYSEPKQCLEETKVDEAVEKAPVGRLRRTMGVIVKTTPPTAAPIATEQPEAEPPTLEQLEGYWGEMLEAMKGELPKLAEQLTGRELRMEGEDMFVVVVNNSYLDAEIKPHLLRMLTYLRKRCGRPRLNCRVEVVYEEKEAVAYAPRDKYDAMALKNPTIEKLRELVPDVDY